MKLKSSEQLNKAAGLLKDRQHEAAFEALKQVDCKALTEKELGVYYLTKGELLILMGDYGHDFLEKAIEIFRISTENWYFAHAKFLRGWKLQSVGESTKAKEPLIEAYSTFLRIGDFNSAARALNRLAKISFMAGEIDQAISNLSLSLRYYERAGNVKMRNALTLNLAMVHCVCGGLQESIRGYQAAQKYFESFDLKIRCVYHIGHAAAVGMSGDLATAKEILHRSSILLSDFKHEEAQYYECLGLICLLDRDFGAAEKALKQGLRLSNGIAPESALISQIKRLMADLYCETDRFVDAMNFARQALAVAEKINERPEIAACYRVFAQLEWQKGNAKKAREWFKKAIDLFGMISSRYELAVTRYLAASSGLYENSERIAMLYLAKEYFESENLKHFIDKVQQELNKPQNAAPEEGKTSREAIDGCPTIIAVNDRMKKILSLAEHIAPSDMTVLLTGQTGTGKDLMARYIHCHSGRKGEFVTVNAAAIPTSMVESELFGYAKGAYTGADRDRPGLFEMADGGTFYLNEVADSPPEFQAKLLEVLETKQVRRLGENKWRQVAFRLVAATNHDLNQSMRDGKFRCDLYHRLNEIPISLPPLQKRVDDIPALVNHFLKEMGLKSSNGASLDIIRRFAMILQQRSWPGNVRELLATVKYVYMASNGNPDGFIDHALGDGARSESDKLTELLQMTRWNRSIVASIMGVSEGTIRNRIKKYGLK